MSRWRAMIFPALFQALFLLGLAAALAWVANAHPRGLDWGAAPQPAATSASAEEGGAPALDLATAQAQHQAGVVFLDARLPADYAAGHIPGARNIPPDMFSDQAEALLADGPKDRPLVAYCHDPACPLGRDLAENLLMLGYTGVKVFTGGMAEWEAAGLPTTAGDRP